jgi:hypothetical protein
MVPAVVEVHVGLVKSVIPAGGAVKPGFLVSAGEEVSDGIHASTKLIMPMMNDPNSDPSIIKSII